MNTTLRQGSRGAEVKALQQRLGISADGIFGPKTAAAVAAFQGKAGLATDSIVGPKTWAALNAKVDTELTGTDPTKNARIDEQEVPKYTVGSVPLSAEQLGAINQQRILARQAYETALSGAARNEALLRLSAQRQKDTEDRLFGRRVDDEMGEMAGRGVARSPRFAGRFLRREAEDLQLKYGEIDTSLGAEIAALQDTLLRAENEMKLQLAALDAEEARGRTNVQVLFPAAQMYG